MKNVVSVFLILLSIIFIAFAPQANGQSTANYTYSTNSDGSLALDMNGGAIDMSSGTTQLLAASTDDTRSSLTNVGFDFFFMGSRVSTFSCTDNGIIELGGNTVGTGTYLISANTTLKLLAPFADDMRVGTDGVIQYKLFGSAPNRILVIEYKNIMIRYISTAAAGTGTWQVRLYESTGVVEYMYGAMATNSATQNAVNVGFGTNTTSNTFVTVDNTHTANTTGSFATFTPTASATVTHLHSTADGSRRYYRFSPAVPVAPSGLSFSSVGISGMTLNWTDNASNEVGYALYRSTDGTNYSYVTLTAANAVSSTQSGLSPNVTYYWKVYAVTEGGLSTALSGTQATNAGTLSGTKTVGPTGDYATLTAAISAIQTNGLAGALTLELQTTYVSSSETFPLTFSNLTTTPSNTITVVPNASATNLSITSSNSTGTILLDNGSYVTFDGEPGGSGGTKQLTLENTSTTGYALKFINDAVSNTVKYCTIKGVNTSATNAVVWFSTTTGTTGNDNNTIDHCDIRDGATTPTNGIYASGTTTTATLNNSGNTISNCNIYNFFSASAVNTGILVSSGNTDWTVSGNSFYQTVSRVFTSANTHTVINISNSSGNNFTVSGNYIGGTSSSIGGTPWMVTGTAVASRFIGIAMSAGTTTASNIQNNTIGNVTFRTSSGAATTNGIWCGINVTAGNVNIGTTTGNTIGAGTGTGSIIDTCTTTGGLTVGINSSSSGTVSISNNTFGSVNAYGSTTSISASIIGIQVSSATGTLTISNNLIGSKSTSNSLNIPIASTNATGSVLTGIISSSSATTVNITNNTIANVNNNYAGTASAGQVRGIVTSSGVNNITGNMIRNFSTTTSNSGSTSSASVIGIAQTSTTAGQTISQDTIHSFTSNPATATTAVQLNGIYYSGPSTGTNLIARNFVHSFSTNSTATTPSTTSTFNGIHIFGGVSTYQNNMIRLGVDAAGSSISGNYTMSGIRDNATANNNFYHNSIYIGGSSVTGSANSHGYIRASTGTTNFQDNIVVNNRSNSSGTGKHYAMSINLTTTFTSNNNVFNGTGTGFVFGVVNTTDASTFSAWKSNTSQDANSAVGDPQFIAPTGTSSTVDLHIHATNPTPIEAAGALVASVTNDFDGDTRSGLTPVDIGADAGNFVGLDLASPVISYTALTNSSSLTTNSFSNVTITDVSGVNTTSGTRARVYYKKTTSANTYVGNTSTDNGWKWVEANGTSSPFDFTIDYSLCLGGSVSLGDTIQYFVVAQDLATTPNVGINSGSFAATPSSVDLTSAAFPVTGTINKYKIVGAPLSGDYTVGTTLFNMIAGRNITFQEVKTKVMREVLVPVVETEKSVIAAEQMKFTRQMKEVEEISYVPMENGVEYKGSFSVKREENPSLSPMALNGVYLTITAAVNDLNERGVNGATRFLLNDATYSGETLPITINVTTNAPTAANTVTIKPNSGVTATVTGAAASGPIFKIANTNYVTIDGSNVASGTSRDLTITNTSTTSPNIMQIGSVGTTPISNVTIKNCILINGAQTSSAVVIGSGTTVGDSGYFSNITIQNNNIQKAFIGVYATGGTVPQKGSNLSYISNTLNTSGANAIRNVGLYAQGVNGALAQGNDIGNFETSTGESDIGVWFATGTINSTIERNNIHDLLYTGTSGYGGEGVRLTSGQTSSGNVIKNNFINNMTGDADSYITYVGSFAPVGIYLSGTQTGINIFDNSIYLYGNTLNYTANGASMGMALGAGSVADIRGNIIVNNLGRLSSTGYGSIGIYAVTANSQFTDINYNDYYINPTGSGVKELGHIASTGSTTLAAWKTATTKDANSISGDPKFTSSSNLHIDISVAGSPVSNTGSTLPGVTLDYDSDTRNASTPDIGADEFTYPVPSAFTLTSPGDASTGQGVSGTLSWSASTNANHYNVYMDQNDPPTTLLAGNVVGTSTGYSGLMPNTVYYWEVYAVGTDSANGGYVKSTNGRFSFTTATPPADPSGLTLSNVTQDSMYLSWTDNADDGGNSETGFIVYRKAGSAPSVGTGSPDSVGTTSAVAGTGGTGNFQDFGLAPNTRYYYRVASRNAQGESNFTGADSTTLATAPGAPALTPSGHSIRVVLTPGSNPASTQFALRFNDTSYVNTSGALVGATPVWGTYAQFGGATGVVVAGLNTSTSYMFDSKARNANNYETAFGNHGTTTTAGAMSGDYTVGVTMFNAMTGHIVAFEKATRLVTIDVMEPVVSADEKSGRRTLDSYRLVKKEVEEEYYRPMENGKPYSGTLVAPASTTTGGVYATITAAIADVVDRGVSGPVRFLLLDATYSAETLPITISPIPGASLTNTVTILPSTGVTTTISGSSATAIFKFNASDFVTIDGSNSGGTDRSMTIANTNTGTSSVIIWVGSNLTDGATNNTIKNTIITGNASTTTAVGIFSGSGTTVYNASTAANSSNTYENNKVSKSQDGIFLAGTSTSVLDQNTIVRNNTLGSSTAGDGTGSSGIIAVYQNNALITGNDVQNVVGSLTFDMVGIDLEEATASTVSSNKIHFVKYTGTSTNKVNVLYTANSTFTSSGTPSGNTFANNMIYDVTSTNTSSFYSVSGLTHNGGFGDKFYFNSVYFNGSMGGTAPSFCFSNGNPLTTTFAANIDVRNNIFYNKGTATGAAKQYAIFTEQTSLTGTTIDYNDLISAATAPATSVLGFYTADRTTLAAWKTATGQSAHAVSGDPLFLSSTNLHINNSTFSPVGNSGVSIAGITTDIDGDTRLSPPDMGADEYVSPAPSAFTIISPTGASQPVSVTLLWNKATGATRYDVYAGTDNPPTTLVANNATDTSFTFNGSPSTTYYWNVYAETPDSAGGSRTISSNGPLSFSTVDAPATPSDLSLETGLNSPGAKAQLRSQIDVLTNSLSGAKTKAEYFAIEQQIAELNKLLTTDAYVQLTWTDNAPNEDSFMVYGKLGSAPTVGSPTDLIGTVAASAGTGGTKMFIHEPLPLNAHYYYKVTAIGAGIEGGFVAADTTTLAQTPGASSFADIQWSRMNIVLDPLDNPSTVEFAIYNNESGKYLASDGTISSNSEVWQTYTNWGGASGKQITGLTRGTVYTFKVKARNSVNLETGFGDEASQQTTFDQPVYGLNEDFTSATFPPAGWTHSRTDTTAWTRKIATAQPNGASGPGARMNFFNLSAGGTDTLKTVTFSLNGAVTASLQFNHAYRSYSGENDSMRVFISSNGGATWTGLLYNDGNPNMATLTPSTTRFVPSNASDWRLNTITIPSGYYTSNIKIAFVAKSDFGNDLWVDNVLVTAKLPPNSLTVKKAQDHDGNINTAGDQTPKSWYLELHSDSLNGATIASGMDSITAVNLLDGTYYALEADSAGWTHLGYSVNGTPTASGNNYAQVTLSGGGLDKTVTFVNFLPNSATISKLADADGDFGTTGDRSSKAWHLELYRTSVSGGNLVTSSETGSITSNNLGDGTYIAVEADSLGWATIGKISNGSPVAGSARYDTFSVANGQSYSVDFVNKQLSGLVVNKFRDTNGGTPSFDVAKTWYLEIHSDSCSGSVVASGTGSTLTAFDLTAGTYYVTEADSAGWTHAGYRLDGGSAVSGSDACIMVTVGSGELHTIDLANFHPNMITVNKMKDADGNLATAGDQSAKAWRLELHADSALGTLVGSVSSNSSLSTTDLGDGTYYAVEADSTGWSHVGYSVNGGASTTSTATSVAVTVTNGQSSSVTFFNTPSNSITVSKFRDTDGGAPTKDVARTWFLAVRSGSCSGTIVASGNSTSVSATHLEAGTYYVTEADSAGWTHLGYGLDGGTPEENSATCVAITLGAGESKSVEFVNFHPNTITVRKFEDTDGGSPSFDSPIEWNLSLKDGSDMTVGEDSDGDLTVTGLGDGTYTACEADGGAAWNTVGYRLDGNVTAGSDMCVSFTVTDGQARILDFANAVGDTVKFRSMPADSFALAVDAKNGVKSIKKTATTVEVKFNIVADSTGILLLDFGMSAKGAITLGKTKLDTISVFNTGKATKFKDTLSVSTGDTIQIDALGLKGKAMKAKYAWGPKGKSKAVLTYKLNAPRLPMPNAHNLGEEIFGQGAFTATGGMVIGEQHLEKGSTFAWVLMKKYADVQKSLVKRSKSGVLRHTDEPRAFDVFSNGKPLVKKQASLPPDKHNNRLFADLVALKLNIKASAMNKTTNGFGELKYSDEGHPFDGMMLKEIAAYTDTFLTEGIALGDMAGDGFDSVIAKVNSAFAGQMDTVSWSSKLVLTGTRSVTDFDFLIHDLSITPTIIVPMERAVAGLPEQYELYQNYPNPFNPATTISFDLPEQSIVTLKIFNVLGQEVVTLLNKMEVESGTQEVNFDAANLPSGIYFYRLTAKAVDSESGASFTQTKKLMLVR